MVSGATSTVAQNGQKSSSVNSEGIIKKDDKKKEEDLRNLKDLIF